jgi:hypothetical protein
MTDVEIIHWEMTHTAEEIRRLFATYSGVMTLPPGPRTELLDIIESVVRGQFGGQITRYYTTPIYLAVGHGGLAG